MNALYSLIIVLGLVLVALVGAGSAGLHALFGVVIPYVAFLIFLIGFIYRVVKWAKSPVPFRIPTTAGQQESFRWIKQNKLDNPSTTWGVVGRMILEILFFRSLFRNTKSQLRQNGGVSLHYGSSKFLWVGAICFHYCFFIILIRHIRFFTDPVPTLFEWLDKLDSILQMGVPNIYVTEFIILGALVYLFLRRICDPKLRYISLPADYFPLLLIIAIVITGVLMRYFIRTDIVAVKDLTMGLVTLHPKVSQNIGVIFYIHLFLVSVLMAYFPWSKLMHAGGIFLSPTRNLSNNNRMKRHINPWNYPVKLHTYEEWEDEYREVLKEAGIPVEKE
ncbi:sulfate reduction electron transfer complex DsrMKJOP subunit DsrM [Desulfothermus naphthae]